MNNQGKNLFERALETEMIFGTQTNPNAIKLKNAVIIKPNFKGEEITITPKNGGRPFKKVGPRFTLVLTEDMFNVLCQEKGTCKYNIWQFDPENPDLKVFTVEVCIKMDSAKKQQPIIELITKSHGRVNHETLTAYNLAILDEIEPINVERVDMVLNPYDPNKAGMFTLWLRSMKYVQKEIVDDISDGDEYWAELEKQIRNEDLPDPNED